MKYNYNLIDCYYSKGERLFLSPEGELLQFGGSIETGPMLEIKAPFEKEQLKQKIDECFSLCWCKTIPEIPKGPSIIEQYLNIRGFKKIVQRFDFFQLLYYKNEKTYSLRKFVKDTNYKSYTQLEMIEMGHEIDFDYILNLIAPV